MKAVAVYTDGGARISGPVEKRAKGGRGKSGLGSYSYVIRDTNKGNEVIETGGDVLLDTTVNEAEWSAVIASLAACARLGATHITVHADSQLVVMQANGVWAVRAEHLKDYFNEVKEQVKNFESVTFQWIPRERNSLADQVGREIVAEYQASERAI